MTVSREAEAATRPLAAAVAAVYRDWLSGQRGLMVLAGVAVLAGIALNWSWLVATGLAPLLLSLAPCLVMCGLGLCMNRMAGRSCESSPSGKNASVEFVVSAASVPRVASSAGTTRAAVRRLAKRKAKRPARPQTTATS